MSSGAEMSSMVTVLADLQIRILATAEELAGGQWDDVAVDLYEVDRTLRMTMRRLEKVARSLP